MLSIATVVIASMVWICGSLILPGIAFIILFSPGDTPRTISIFIGMLICGGVFLMKLFTGSAWNDPEMGPDFLTIIFFLSLFSTLFLYSQDDTARVVAHVMFGLIFAFFAYYTTSYFWLLGELTGHQ